MNIVYEWGSQEVLNVLPFSHQLMHNYTRNKNICCLMVNQHGLKSFQDI